MPWMLMEMSEQWRVCPGLKSQLLEPWSRSPRSSAVIGRREAEGIKIMLRWSNVRVEGYLETVGLQMGSHPETLSFKRAALYCLTSLLNDVNPVLVETTEPASHFLSLLLSQKFHLCYSEMRNLEKHIKNKPFPNTCHATKAMWSKFARLAG